MNRTARVYKAALVGIAVLLFCVSAQMQKWLNLERTRLGFTRLAPLENAPPVLAFTTVALGGFRGLIANALWMRATDLQDEEKFFEMVQLADWITKLEPHFVDVWRVQAWNMAYNISVKFKDPEDRWHWVQRGIQLLRDDGIRVNPGETLIYRDLSWLYQHKIGQNLDDANMLYKLRVAQEFQPLLGAEPDFQALLHPQTAQDRERVRILREDKKMDPKLIQEVNEEYGPLDWRLPDAHAIYWAELGRRLAKPADQETLRRSIYQSMAAACVRGGSLGSSVTNFTAQNFAYLLRPNLNLVPAIDRTYLKLIAEQTTDMMKQNSQNAHKNWLKDAVVLLYVNGRMNNASHWFNYLKNTYTNALVGKQANISLDDYCLGQILEDENGTDRDRANACIQALFHNSFRSLVGDDDDAAVNFQNLARAIWEHYDKKIGAASRERIGLPPLSQIRQSVLDRELDPRGGLLSPYAQALLRTKLGLPAPKPISTPPPAAEAGLPASQPSR